MFVRSFFFSSFIFITSNVSEYNVHYYYRKKNVNEVIKTILDFFVQKITFKPSEETSFCSYVWKYHYWCSGITIALLFACSVLCFCLVASLWFWCYWCFWCVQNLFVKKNKEFKTALIISFTLLLQACI